MDIKVSEVSKPLQTPITVQQAVQILKHALNTDRGYRISWKANIAMAFKDQWFYENPDANNIDINKIHDIANSAADHFLNLLCKD